MESSNVIVSYRVGVALARQGEGFAPAFLTLSTHSLQDIVVDRLIDAGIYSGDPAWLTSQLRQESYVMDLFVADNLLGTVDLDKSGRIRRCDRAASIIFGHSPDSLSQGNLALPELFSTPIPPNRIPVRFVSITYSSKSSTSTNLGTAHHARLSHNPQLKLFQ